MKAPTERQLAEFGNGRKHLFVDELTDILRAVKGASILHHTFLLVCYQHALRAQEVCNIRLEDLEIRQKLLRTERLKGGLDTTQDIVQVKGNSLIYEYTALKAWLAERVEDGGQFLFNSQKAERNESKVLYEYKPLADAKLDSIKASSLTGFKSSRLIQGRAIARVNSTIHALRAVLNHAVEDSLIDVATKLKILLGANIRSWILSPEQEPKYLAASTEPLKTVATIILDAGLRPDE